MPPPFRLSELFRRLRGREECRRRTLRVKPGIADCNLGTILDVSATGARIACRRLYRPGVGSRIDLTVATEDGAAVTVPCVVCWTELRGGVREAGLEFTVSSATDLTRLASIVTHRHAA